jgi:hypothetical protein
VAGASLLTRDENAMRYLEGWYKTDKGGEATIETAANPVVVVVIFGNTLTTQQFSSKPGHDIIIMLPQQ